MYDYRDNVRQIWNYLEVQHNSRLIQRQTPKKQRIEDEYREFSAESEKWTIRSRKQNATFQKVGHLKLNIWSTMWNGKKEF